MTVKSSHILFSHWKTHAFISEGGTRYIRSYSLGPWRITTKTKMREWGIFSYENGWGAEPCIRPLYSIKCLYKRTLSHCLWKLNYPFEIRMMSSQSFLQWNSSKACFPLLHLEHHINATMWHCTIIVLECYSTFPLEFV